MGLLTWMKRRKSARLAITRAASVDVGDTGPRQDVVDEIDRLAHEILTAGAAAGNSGGVTVMSSANVFVDGRAVSADDPRAREGMLEAVSKLRARGFDDLADDLERQLGAAAPAATGGPYSPAPTDALSPPPDALSAPPADPAEAPSSAEPLGDGGVGAPSAPSPPTPPTPPTGSA